MNIFEELTGKIKGTNKRIVFPEGEDKRVLGACVRLKKDGLLTPIVLGNVEEIKKTAKELNVSRPSVCAMLTELAHEGYINKEHYGIVYLCEKGKEIGKTYSAG